MNFDFSISPSSAGRDEANVRQKLIETGDVDLMIAIRSNFFYTRTVQCELWFLNRGKPEAYRGKVLMIDARNIFRKVTRKIFDFSPEIEANDWSLTPSRYVGVASEEEDEDFDETLREIHVELEDLNAEAVQLAAIIKNNFEELGI